MFNFGFEIKGVIIEGADQQGKSTLCKMINEAVGWKVKHFGLPPKDFNFHSDYFFGRYMISDRNFLSEIVYSNFRNDKHRVKDVELLQQEFINRKVVLILVDREEHFIHDNIRREDFNSGQIISAIHLYKTAFENLKMPKAKINIHKDFDKIQDLLKRLR